MRLQAMLRFADRYWPGIYSPVLLMIRKGLERRKTDIPIDMLCTYASEIAALGTCRTLMRWSEGNSLGGRITPFRDLLCYACQDLATPDMIREVVAGDRWWHELASDLAMAVEAQREIPEQEAAGLHLIQDLIASAGDAIREIGALGDGQKPLTKDRIEETSKATEALVCVLDRLADALEGVRLSLEKAVVDPTADGVMP
jgi:hypothetical protein